MVISSETSVDHIPPFQNDDKQNNSNCIIKSLVGKLGHYQFGSNLLKYIKVLRQRIRYRVIKVWVPDQIKF